MYKINDCNPQNVQILNFKIIVTHNSSCMAKNIIGAGFWGKSGPLLNNSAIEADAMGRINTIYCHSSSRDDNVGRWISPAGMDITDNHRDNFIIRFNNGPYYPSYSTLQFLEPLTSSFSDSERGVYSCLTQENNGDFQTLHIGIFPYGYQGMLILQQSEKHSGL